MGPSGAFLGKRGGHSHRRGVNRARAPRTRGSDRRGSDRNVRRDNLRTGMRLRVGARTDTGRVRALNEDVYVSRPEQGLFVVCDGMGGAPAGEVASQVAVETILEQLDAAGEEAAVETARTGAVTCPGPIAWRKPCAGRIR